MLGVSCWVTPCLLDRRTQTPGHSAKFEVMLFNASDWENEYDQRFKAVILLGAVILLSF